MLLSDWSRAAKSIPHVGVVWKSIPHPGWYDFPSLFLHRIVPITLGRVIRHRYNDPVCECDTQNSRDRTGQGAEWGLTPVSTLVRAGFVSGHWPLQCQSLQWPPEPFRDHMMPQGISYHDAQMHCCIMPILRVCINAWMQHWPFACHGCIHASWRPHGIVH